jgi:hypothetical protein
MISKEALSAHRGVCPVMSRRAVGSGTGAVVCRTPLGCVRAQYQVSTVAQLLVLLDGMGRLADSPIRRAFRLPMVARTDTHSRFR